MEKLESELGYTFKDKSLLTQALTHSSYGFENACPYNERLEFLGDSVLGYVISKELFLTFPKESEGHLSKLKSVLVSTQSLAKKARLIGLGRVLRLGKGEHKSGGRQKQSILADATEALIGAITLDGGLQNSEAFIIRLFRKDINSATVSIKNSVDFKTLLQERLQGLGLGLPRYKVVEERGPAHNRNFHVQVFVGDFEGPTGSGSSKKNAQQDCAKLLLEDERAWKILKGISENA